MPGGATTAGWAVATRRSPPTSNVTAANATKRAIFDFSSVFFKFPEDLQSKI
jgi:hypothetical protein